MAEAAVDVEATSEEFQDAAEEVENEEPKNSTFTMENGKTDMTRTMPRPSRPPQSEETPPTKVLDPTKTIARGRQKTMVVESPITLEIRKLLADLKQKHPEDVAGLEKSLISFVQQFENKCNRKMYEVENKQTVLSICKNNLVSECLTILKVPVGSSSSAGGSMCGGKCDSARKLRVDLDSAQCDIEKRYHEYEKLHEQFSQARNTCLLQKKEYMKLEEVLNEDRNKYKELKEKFLRLRADAQKKLSDASEDFHSMELKHAEATKGLKFKCRQMEVECNNLRDSLERKMREAEEYRTMLDQLIKEVEPGQSDNESER